MAKEITYYYSPISPWSYLGHERLTALAASMNVEVKHRPYNIMEVFARTGGVPLAERPASRQAYRMSELKRWREFLDIELTLEPKFFPTPFEQATLCILACDQEADRNKLSLSLMKATWVQDRDISDVETLRQILGETDMQADLVLAKAQEASVKAQYVKNTEDAIAQNVFGAPSYVYNDEVFWGQDRLELLEFALKK